MLVTLKLEFPRFTTLEVLLYNNQIQQLNNWWQITQHFNSQQNRAENW